MALARFLRQPGGSPWQPLVCTNGHVLGNSNGRKLVVGGVMFTRPVTLQCSACELAGAAAPFKVWRPEGDGRQPEDFVGEYHPKPPGPAA